MKFDQYNPEDYSNFGARNPRGARRGGTGGGRYGPSLTDYDRAEEEMRRGRGLGFLSGFDKKNQF